MPVRQPLEEEYLDVFQNIESAIAVIYRQDPELTDWDVESALEALIRQYRAEWRGKEVRPASLNTDRKRQVYDSVSAVCEWRLGRNSILKTEDGQPFSLPADPITLEELVAILKRLRKSVQFWDKEAGRRGYLAYIDQFIP